MLLTLSFVKAAKTVALDHWGIDNALWQQTEKILAGDINLAAPSVDKVYRRLIAGNFSSVGEKTVDKIKSETLYLYLVHGPLSAKVEEKLMEKPKALEQAKWFLDFFEGLRVKSQSFPGPKPREYANEVNSGSNSVFHTDAEEETPRTSPQPKHSACKGVSADTAQPPDNKSASVREPNQETFHQLMERQKAALDEMGARYDRECADMHEIFEKFMARDREAARTISRSRESAFTKSEHIRKLQKRLIDEVLSRHQLYKDLEAVQSSLDLEFRIPDIQDPGFTNTDFELLGAPEALIHVPQRAPNTKFNIPGAISTAIPCTSRYPRPDVDSSNSAQPGQKRKLGEATDGRPSYETNGWMTKYRSVFSKTLDNDQDFDED